MTSLWLELLSSRIATTIDHVGEDLLQNIFGRLPALSFASAACFSRSWNLVCHHILCCPELPSACLVNPSLQITTKLGSKVPVVTNRPAGVIGREEFIMNSKRNESNNLQIWWKRSDIHGWNYMKRRVYNEFKESIADHMYRMALMALIADDLPGINRERCIKIALVHDIAEAALNEMCEILGGGKRAEEIKEPWREYEDNASLEANLVKDFDKIEMILQALEYETGKFQTEIGKS
ncbi:putative HD/PDEase domain, F-box-like domain superfamily, 5'-deoxynucleotidase YfbR/HDDC2 [Helianthus debilis subsp. tardiflorus]